MSDEKYKIRLLIEKFDNLYSNIRKSKNNVNSKNLLESQKCTINEIIRNFKIILKKLKNDIQSIEYNEFVLEYEQLLVKREYVFAIINKKLTMSTENNTTSTFDVRTATAVIQIYDGASESLPAFVDACNLMKDLTDNTQQSMLIKFIKTRLTGKARYGLPDNVNTFNDLITNIKQRCQDSTSPEQIVAKLKSIKQKENLDSFCDQIESIANKLKCTYLQQKIPEDVVNNMVKKVAVDALINGVSNSETKIILKAGNFDTVKDAIQKVQENNSNNQTSAMFSISTQRQYHRGWNKPSGFRRNNINNYRPKFNNNTNSNNHNYRPRFENNFRNYQRGNSQSNHRGRGRQYNNHNSNRNLSGRMLIMGANEVHVPSNYSQDSDSTHNNTIHMQPTSFNQRNNTFLEHQDAVTRSQGQHPNRFFQ